MESTVTIPALQQMKRDGQKIVGVVAWDFQIAQIVDRAGVDIVSVGDSVGTNLWGHPSPLEVTMEEMIVVCKAVRRGVKRSIVSCDVPFGPPRRALTDWTPASMNLLWYIVLDKVQGGGRPKAAKNPAHFLPHC